MTATNSEVVRRVTEYLNAHGKPGPPELHAPNLTFLTRGDTSGTVSRYDGYDGLVRATEDFREVWDVIQAEPVELIEEGDVVVAVFRFSLKSQAGVPIEVHEGWAYWLRDGRIHRIEQHASREDALRAAGITG